MTSPIRTARLSSDPQACGGRISQPWLIAVAQRYLRDRGILIVEMHHPKLDEGDRVYLATIAARIGITRKDSH